MSTRYIAMPGQPPARNSDMQQAISSACGRKLFRLRSRAGRGPMSGVAWQTAALTLYFVVRSLTRGADVRSSFRGIWHGLAGNISAPY